jgi:acetoin utilization deacetylase AcuC-like enzyme
MRLYWTEFVKSNFLLQNLRKILLVDFDVHHGDGSQDIFLDDDSVLFISVHR